MRLKITHKGFQIPIKFYNHLNFHLEKITKQLSTLKDDLLVVNLNIKKISQKYHSKKHYQHSFTSYADRKLALAFFEGTINLSLPKKSINLNFKGQSLDEIIDKGIDRLKKEIQKYKNLHSKSQSKYPNHQSIRKDDFYE